MPESGSSESKSGMNYDRLRWEITKSLDNRLPETVKGDDFFYLVDELVEIVAILSGDEPDDPQEPRIPIGK